MPLRIKTPLQRMYAVGCSAVLALVISGMYFDGQAGTSDLERILGETGPNGTTIEAIDKASMMTSQEVEKPSAKLIVHAPTSGHSVEAGRQEIRPASQR